MNDCSLPEDELEVRIDRWRAVARRALVGADRLGGGTRFRFRPDAREGLEALVRAEAACCGGHLGLGLGGDATTVDLSITGTSEPARRLAGLLADALVRR